MIKVCTYKSEVLISKHNKFCTFIIMNEITLKLANNKIKIDMTNWPYILFLNIIYIYVFLLFPW